MRNSKLAACAVALAAAVAACNKAPAPDPSNAAAAADPSVTQPASGTDVATAGAQSTASDTTAAATHAAGTLLDSSGNPIALLPFDIDSVPLSTASLGDLPFFSLPDGYGPVNRPRQTRFARFPFRLGEGLHWVEGASWNSLIRIAPEARSGKEYSQLELRRNLESVLEQAGAKQVFAGPLRRDLYYGPQLEGEIGSGFIEGVNMGNVATTVHVIRQADRNIWVQLSTDTLSAGLVIVEERPFQATARWNDAFPYLSLPVGYDSDNRPRTRDFDMYPFWTGHSFEEVEGRTAAVGVQAERKAHSMHEVRRNLEAMMAEARATRVFEGRIPREASERYGAEVRSPYSGATGFSWHDYDSVVYRIDRPDGRQVWVHARLDTGSAGWVVVERKDFVQTSALLQADVLKQQLDTVGRVAIQVNFATDKADILPASQPQIDQVRALLQADPSLRLSVEGHTDATGSAENNRTLSKARAQSVVAALTARDIDVARLSAAGFGPDKPVADNATEDGKAKNRRVELVKQP